MTLENTPTAMQALAALEEWCAAVDDDRRVVAFEFAETWRVYVTLAGRSAEHTGRTLADAMAQAAQAVVSDPHSNG